LFLFIQAEVPGVEFSGGGALLSSWHAAPTFRAGPAVLRGRCCPQ
jgi:hypothetical protein